MIARLQGFNKKSYKTIIKMLQLIKHLSELTKTTKKVN